MARNLPEDDNNVSVAREGVGFVAKKSVTFTGGTANTVGDHDGTADPATLFTVTGEVWVKVYARVTTTIVGAGTVEVGVTGLTAGLIAQVADATDMAVGEIWHDATVDALVELSSVPTEKMINKDIILTVGTANLTAGAMEVYCLWYPISEDGDVEPA